LTFTGGIGEGSATLRAAACERLGFLGVDLDPERNEQASVEDMLLSRPQNPVAVVLVHAREDVVIAREVRRVLSADG
jgi:acetate kinase